MAKKVKEQLERLGYRGPHRVDVGDLGFSGAPGKIYLPRDAKGPVPLVAFAHDWTKSSRYYTETLRHLASWGLMAVATDAGGGLFPDYPKYIDALSESIEAVAYATLGSGRARADVRRIALFGHGIGAGVAVDLASYRTDIKAVVAAFPKPVKPSAVERSILVDAAGLVLSQPDSEDAAEATAIGRTWNGPSIHRRLPGTVEDGLVEASPLLRTVGLASGDHKTQQIVRRLATGFLLATVAEDNDYKAFADPEETFPGTVLVDHERLDKEEAEEIKQAMRKRPMWQNVLLGAAGR